MFTSGLNSSFYKTKLEHQMFLAQEHPARLYDISDCAISQIPRGVFSFCRVLRKYSLNLSGNKLSSLDSGGSADDLELLGMLILSRNLLRALPSDFCRLKNMESLYMDQNRVSKFPVVLTKLPHLKILSLKGNCIKIVPKETSHFACLLELNLLDNPIAEVSPDICAVATLRVFDLQVSGLRNIDKEVIAQGSVGVWNYLCRAKGIPERCIETDFTKAPTSCFSQMYLEKSQSIIEYNKMGHDLDVLISQHDCQLTSYDRDDRCRHIKSIKKNSEMEDRTIKEVLTRKYERERLFERVNYEQLSSQDLVDRIQQLTKHAGKIEELKSRVGWRQLCCITNWQHSELDTEQRLLLLDSMKDSLKKYAAQQAQYQSTLMVNAAETPMARRQSITSQQMGINEVLQRDAYRAKRCLSDAPLTRLHDARQLIERKLVQLSAMEMYDSKLEHICQRDSGSRAQLVLLLKNMQVDSDVYQKQIDEELKQLDDVYSQEGSPSGYWLVQYWRLDDTNLRNQQELKELLQLGGLESWSSNFNKYDCTIEILVELTEVDLLEMGVGPAGERARMIRFLTEWKFDPIKSASSAEATATAPSEECAPSAPSINILDSTSHAPTASNNDSDLVVVTARKETECCICLDADADTLILNCGHVCCCKQCSLSQRLCPLCRLPITQRVLLQL